MTARYYRDLILRLWWVIMLCTLFFGSGAYIGSILFFPVYQSSALVQVVVRAPSTTANTVLATDRIVRTESQLATGVSLLTQIASQYPGLTEAKLRSELSVTALANTQLIQITVQDASSTRGATLANAIASVLVAQQQVVVKSVNESSQQPLRQEITSLKQQLVQAKQQLAALGTPPKDASQATTLQNQITSLQQQLNLDEVSLSRLVVNEASNSFILEIAQHAQPSATPITSRIVEGTAAGAASGALLGFLLMLMFDRLAWRVRTPEEAGGLLGVTVLGELRRTTTAMTKSDADATEESSYVGLSETARSLARSLDFMGIDAPLRTIAIVSPERTSASRALASGLALYLASSARRTLLIDAHLVGGHQGQQFGVPGSPGLSNAALDARSRPDEAISLLRYAHQPERMHAPMLLVVPSGAPPPNPERVLTSSAMKRIFASLAESGADVVVVDMPPLRGRTGTAAMLRQVDGVLLVVDLRQTRKDHLIQAKRQLGELGVKMVGCVVASAAAHEAPSRRTTGTATGATTGGATTPPHSSPTPADVAPAPALPERYTEAPNVAR
ncbi:MAG: hypothetical protein ABI068_16100 [Ktedonobacterales bacterium]